VVALPSEPSALTLLWGALGLETPLLLVFTAGAFLLHLLLDAEG